MRSGTTLFMQWLSRTGLFAYPTNLLSRFYQAPIIGSKIQLLLTDPRYNFRDELGEFVQSTVYASENGKTLGALSPNEFWYFWRRFLAEPGRDVWTDAELRQSMDTRTMLAELSGMTNVFQKPFAAKAMLFNYNIPFLDSVIDRVAFIQVKRDPLTNIASVLDARRRQLGDERHWYSFDIPEKESLRELEPVAQVAGQIHYINQAIERGLQSVEESRKMTVQYEDFCANPKAVFDTLVNKLGWQDCHYTGAERFDVSRQIAPEQSAVIASAVGRFA
ncbi:hypothetical protein RBSWK_01667 [Rhodopirellula baltica SWK14]|uniref:Sulfotransferase n=2 Tax=Rhodopirellula baltica TaxID=265606 RepID=L7CMV6_RHOBT|nr:hypothetical protein RBSWK_01667 [Rhodopirellula baltica SWK14]